MLNSRKEKVMKKGTMTLAMVTVAVLLVTGMLVLAEPPSGQPGSTDSLLRFGNPRTDQAGPAEGDSVRNYRIHHTLRVLKRYLNLSDEQVAEMVQILQESQIVIKGLREEVHQNKIALKEAVEAGDEDAAGHAVIQIHGLRQMIADQENEQQAAIEDLLTPEQYDRLQWVRRVAVAQAVIPAFKNVGLLKPLPPEEAED